MKEHEEEFEGVEDSLTVENAIFETALQLTVPGERQLFLERVFRDDERGKRGMEELLRMAGSSAAFFLEGKRCRAELAHEVLEEMPRREEEVEEAETEREGEVIGRYTLRRKIGEGGGGEIFEAVQDGMFRPVALKIIRSGMDTESVVSRFEVERHVLEIMEHPNIARVLDAGRTLRGRPYFVMELVRGAKITDFCDGERLGIRERLVLFQKVCLAIQHAHQKGIVHRDIKPSNILVENVDGTYVPKVIDFGIAKALQGRARVRADITHFDHFMGTPAYMSPEQIEMGGIDIDTRADIYGLGALLYELLCGRPPFDTAELMGKGMTEMRRLLMEELPPLPSEVVRALGSGREKWAAQLRGELDWVVCKAMEKDRNRRYHTVNSLAMEVERYLQNEPVLARKPSRRYSLQKFFQRNRAACLLGVAMLMSLLGGLGMTTWLYFRERQAVAEQARLQRLAVARANVSRAAILLSEGDTEAADRLLRQSPLETIDASPEAAEVFRSLGRWNAVFGRWKQAAACFRLMNEANRLSDPVRIVEEVDLLMTAPAYLEAGDREAYLEFRDEVMARFIPATNSLQGEHLLKVCLLLPADVNLLERLESTAQACREGAPTKKGVRAFPSWNALSLALYHYRLGEDAEAVREAEICLRFEDSARSRVTAARCVLAMAKHRLGRKEEAQVALERAREDLRWVEAQIDESGFPAIGTWFAWSSARVLAAEARLTLRK